MRHGQKKEKASQSSEKLNEPNINADYVKGILSP